ncbi:MAG: NPCBM/NEW2 domain-containing protein [Planctomycetia bacterium]|nr:NPCBM/NEW2 domain-containing protein [Planctomycetia bacterium]
MDRGKHFWNFKKAVCLVCSGLFFLILPALNAKEAADTTPVWVSEMDVIGALFTPCAQPSGPGWNVVRSLPSWKIGDKVYLHNFEHYSPGSYVFQLPKGKIRFSAGIKIRDGKVFPGQYTVNLFGDGKLLWTSGIITSKSEMAHCDLNLENVHFFVINTVPVGKFQQRDTVIWFEPKFEAEKSVAKEIHFVNFPVDDEGNVLDPCDEKSREYLSLTWQLKAGMSDRIKSQAYHPQATLMKEDRDPLDIILRRTAALCDSLKRSEGGPSLDAESKKLDQLQKESAKVDPGKKKERRILFDQVFDLRREIALANPLLDFKDIVFIKRHYNPEMEKRGNHMCDEFFGFHGRPGGGLYLLKNAFAKERKDQQLVDLLKAAPITNGRLKGQKLDANWAFLAPTLSYDGKEIFFAATDAKTPRHCYQWTDDTCYHLFKIGADGKDLIQLTDGSFNDIDPWVMPNGRVVFISERRGGFGRCHARPCPSYTLHSMEKDGSDIVCLSPHETNEWAPMVDKNGMIVYTRWDYVDRGFNQAHHPWITYPDGRDPRAIQGNYSEEERMRPHFETSFKPVPDSHKVVGTAKGHHTQYFGSVILLDPNVEDDDNGGDPMAPIRRITPDQAFPEAELGVHGPPTNYGQPFPLSEEFYLVAYDSFSGSGRGPYNNFGLYLLDVFGNKIFIYRDPAISIQCPWPVAEREVPPVIPHQTLVGIPKSQTKESNSSAGIKDKKDLPKKAVVGVTNVYNTNRPFPEGSKIKELRIVQILPKTTWNCNDPWIGYGAEKGARKVLGTVPVEADGSARFEMPVDVPVYFQVLDDKGVAVQSMRSATYVKPGETLTCQGCHEGRHSTSMNRLSGFPAAFQRKPSEIKPEMPGSNPFNYPVLVQSILDKHCVDCHSKEAAAEKTFPLDRGPEGRHFFTSYLKLRPYVFVYSSNKNQRMDPPIHYLPASGGAYDGFLDARTFPGKFGANASKLWTLLKEKHYGVQLNDLEMRSIALWLDNNADFYGAYEYDTLATQRKGGVVKPTLE